MTKSIIFWNYDENNFFTIRSYADLTAKHMTEMFEKLKAKNEEFKYMHPIWTFNDPRINADYHKWLRDNF